MNNNEKIICFKEEDFDHMRMENSNMTLKEVYEALHGEAEKIHLRDLFQDSHEEPFALYHIESSAMIASTLHHTTPHSKNI